MPLTFCIGSNEPSGIFILQAYDQNDLILVLGHSVLSLRVAPADTISPPARLPTRISFKDEDHNSGKQKNGGVVVSASRRLSG
jgi:hypothetical protein